VFEKAANHSREDEENEPSDSKKASYQVNPAVRVKMLVFLFYSCKLFRVHPEIGNLLIFWQLSINFSDLDAQEIT